MHRVTLGRSVCGEPIIGWFSTRGAFGGTLIFGGFHGDEPKSVYVVRRLLEALSAEKHAPPGVWAIVPLVNPDGYARRTRRSARKVDINRNFPTRNWTLGDPRSRMFGGHAPAGEPETRAVMRIVERFKPAVIVTIHSISGGRECNNYDGPGRRVANALSRCNGYPVTASIGYPTPGSFGSWAGRELGIATVTLELPSRHSPQRCWADNAEGLLRLCQ